MQRSAQNSGQAQLPRDPAVEALRRQADLLQGQRRLWEAVECYRQVLARSPDYAEVYNNLGIALTGLGLYDQAVESGRQAVRCRPERPDFQGNLACALQYEGRLDEAEVYCREAIRLRPDWAEACYNLASVLRDQGRVAEAIEATRAAIRLRPAFPEARWNLSHLLLLNGEWTEGWNGPDWWRCDLRPFGYPPERGLQAWDGSSFVGRRLLVLWERGFGDNFQFVRYLPRVKALGGTVILEAPPSMRDLLSRVQGVDELVQLTPDHLPAVEFDLYTPLLGLAGLFHTTLETIPAEVPYIHADPVRVERWSRRITGSGLKIGIVWSGDPNNGNNVLRSCPLDCFTRLAPILGVNLYSLQKGPATAQISGGSERTRIVDLGPHLEDFSDTAAALRNLDLVISVDTSVAHLAGAMGRPVWVLLSFVPDWRWLLNREDCPWYPSARLFRQSRPRDWTGVLDRIEGQVRAWIDQDSVKTGLDLPQARV